MTSGNYIKFSFLTFTLSNGSTFPVYGTHRICALLGKLLWKKNICEK